MLEWSKKITFPFLRNFFFFLFAYIPYAPIRRVNKPNLNGPMLWCSNHSNFLCDVVVPGYEPPVPTKFLGKAPLFRPGVGGFLRYCGALPLIRAQDVRKMAQAGADKGQVNKDSFAEATKALIEGHSIAIYPEGTSIVIPGLKLPLKTGAVRLAFGTAESTNFKLNLRLQPVGLEFTRRTRLLSGLTIRYGQAIYIRDYKEQYLKDPEAAVRLVNDKLTEEMIGVCAHFDSMDDVAYARRIYLSGLSDSMFDLSKAFGRLKKAAVLDHFLNEFKEFKELCRERGFPLWVWLQRERWRNWPVWKKLGFVLGLPLWLSVLFWSLLNNAVAEYCIDFVAEFLSADETEFMSIKVMLATFFLWPFYWLQFKYFPRFFYADLSQYLNIYSYFAVNLVTWYVSAHIKKSLRTVASQLIFGIRLGRNRDLCAQYAAIKRTIGSN